MKENSIEEDVKIVENYLANSAINETDSDFFKNGGWETVDLKIPKSMQHILSDYKRVLKENDILEDEKTEAWQEWNNLEQGSYETEQNLKQQIKQLQKENKDLKAENYELNNRITDLLENIPIQKVKDKIKELKKKVEELTDEKGYWGGSDLLEQIKVLQQLLEKEQ